MPSPRECNIRITPIGSKCRTVRRIYGGRWRNSPSCRQTAARSGWLYSNGHALLMNGLRGQYADLIDSRQLRWILVVGIDDAKMRWYVSAEDTQLLLV